MKTILQSLSRNARQCILIGIYMLLSSSVWAQTAPLITFTTTATGSFSFGLGASKADVSATIDWGDGKQLSLTIGTESVTIVSPNNLKGITKVSIYGSDISYLNLQEKSLTSIDVSNCPNLENLNCALNNLTALDISKNALLADLQCQFNKLKLLDITKNLLLTKLICDSNALTNLDVTKNTLLTELYCDGNQISSLDISKNTQLTLLWCYINKITSLNVTKNTLLKTLNCSHNQIDTLDVKNNLMLTNLDCSYNFLTFSTLPKPDSRYTKYAYAPQGLHHLDSPGTNNNIINSLTDQHSVADKDGHSQTTTYIWKQADDVLKEGKDYTVLSPGVFSFTKVPTLLFFCEMTNPVFPDLSGKYALKFAYLMSPAITLSPGSLDAFNFEIDTIIKNNLIVVNYGEGKYYSNDPYNSIPARNSIYPIKIYGAGIQFLDVSYADLNSIDVGNCITLTGLSCYYNKISSLDVSKNSNLTTLYCWGNQINMLDVSKNLILDDLDCSNNKLATLDVSINSALKKL